MPDYRRADVPGGTYFFMLVTERRDPFLCTDLARRVLRDAFGTIQHTVDSLHHDGDRRIPHRRDPMAQLIEYVTPPPRVPLRRSAWGLASLCLGLVIVAGYTALIALQPKLLADSDAIVAAFLAAIVILPSTGLAFGVVAVRQPNRRRGVAIAGVTLNGLLLAYGLWNLGLIILFE